MVQNYRLPADLGPCAKHGLSLAAGVTLDGGGRTIRGTRQRSSSGVILDEKATGARVTNLVVTGFERGIRLAGVDRARVDRVEAHNNGDPVAHKGYGIDVARGAANNVIEDVHVHHNADEGIHIGRAARGNRIVGSRVENNFRENVYFLENSDNRLERSEMRGGGASSVFVKHASGVVLVGNRIDGRGVQVRGSSRDVRLEDNQLTGRLGLTIQPYTDRKTNETTVPRGITVVGGRIETESTCVRLLEARSVRLEGSRLACRRSLEVGADSDVFALDTPIDGVDCRGTGRVEIATRVSARFLAEGGEPMPGVTVENGSGVVAKPSGVDGRWEGDLVTSTLRCPGPRPAAPVELRVRWKDGSRRISAVDLRGDVELAGE